MHNYSEIIGTLAATLTTCAYVPQVYKVLKTKDTKSISLAMFLMMNVGVALWLAYGIIINKAPIIWANLATLCLAGYIFYVKIKNVRNSAEKY